MNRIGGLDVCDVCFHGGASHAVCKRGWSLEAKSWSQRVNKDVTYYYAEAKGSITTASKLNVVFRRNAGWWRIPALFVGITIDDPLFNKLVFTWPSDADATHAFLEGEGAQSAVMDLVGEPARVVIDGANLIATAVAANDPGAVNQARVEAELAVLMAHLHAFAATY